MVILVLGLPGSGKSYFASKLAQKIDAEYLNSDQLRKEMFPERTYSESEKAKVYEALLKKMKALIKKEKNVVVDATFHNNKRRAPFISGSKGKIAFIEVRADETIIQKRLEKIRRYSEADFKVYQLIKQEWEPLNQPHLILHSTNDNIDWMLQKAEEYLKDEKRTN